MRRTTVKILILCAAMICAAALIFGVSMSLASGSLTRIENDEVNENRRYEAGTNAFSLSYNPTVNVTYSYDTDENQQQINPHNPTASVSVSVSYADQTNNPDDTTGGDYYDLVIIPQISEGGYDWRSIANITNASPAVTPVQIDDGFVFKNIALSQHSTITFNIANILVEEPLILTLSFKAYAVRHNDNNRFVGSLFRLQSVMDEYHHLSGENNTAVSPSNAYNEVYPATIEGRDTYGLLYIYIVKPFAVDEPVTINAPAYMNVLDNNITLDADLTIKHGYGGLFAIETTGGRINANPSLNPAPVMEIDTPYGYYVFGKYTYSSEQIDVLGLPTDNVNKTNMGVLIDSDTLAENDTLRSALIAEAIAYITDYIPSHIYDDVILPKSYHNYGIDFSYTVTGTAMTSGGKVTRDASSQSENITVTAAYNRTEPPSAQSVTIPFTVVGTDDAAEKTAYGEELQTYLRDNSFEHISGESYRFAYDADLINFTERFNADSGNTGDLTLTVDGGAHFYIRLNSDADITYSGGEAANRTFNGEPVLTAADVSDVTVTSLSFKYNGTVCSIEYTVQCEYEYNTGEGDPIVYTEPESATEELTITAVLSDVEVAYLRRNEIVTNNMPSTVTVTGEAPISFTVASMSRDEINSYIERNVGLYYFLDTGNTRPLIAYNDVTDTISYGDMMPIDGVASLAYKIYYVPVTAYETYLSSGMTAQALDTLKGTHDAASDADIDSSFELDTVNNELKYNTVFSESSSKLLLLIADCTYNDSSAHSIVREIMLPGIGVFDSERFTTGRTFADFINDIAADDYMLIESNADRHYSFTTGSGVMQLQLDITAVNGSEVEVSSTSVPVGGESETTYQYSGGDIIDFCSIVNITDTDNAANNRSYINITPANIPAEDSLIELTATLYAVSGVDRHIFSTQKYSFTIPGIYHYDPDGDTNVVKDMWVYMAMLQTYGDFKGYLLTSDAKKEMAEFNCSSTIADIVSGVNTENPSGHIINPDYIDRCKIIDIHDTNGDGIINISDYPYDRDVVHSIEGVQYLTGTGSMIFDGVKVESLEPFYNYEGGALTALSMDGCSITQGMLEGVSPSLRPLYKLDRVTNLSLDGNAITAIVNVSGEPLIYRNVTELSLNSQTALTDITGIEKIPYIETLYIKDNHIENFAPLLELDDISAVYLSGNTYLSRAADTTEGTQTNGADMYGTNGEVNVPNYVALIHRGVEVYVFVNASNEDIQCEITDSATDLITSENGYHINKKMEYLAVTLNSIIIPDNYWDLNEKPSILFKDNTSPTPPATLTVSTYNTHTKVGDGREHWIVSVTEDSVTVYKEFFYTRNP